MSSLLISSDDILALILCGNVLSTLNYNSHSETHGKTGSLLQALPNQRLPRQTISNYYIVIIRVLTRQCISFIWDICSSEPPHPPASTFPLRDPSCTKEKSREVQPLTLPERLPTLRKKLWNLNYKMLHCQWKLLLYHACDNQRSGALSILLAGWLACSLAGWRTWSNPKKVYAAMADGFAGQHNAPSFFAIEVPTVVQFSAFSIAY